MTYNIKSVGTTKPKYLRLHMGESHFAYIFYHEEEWEIKFHDRFNEH